MFMSDAMADAMHGGGHHHAICTRYNGGDNDV